MTGMFGHQQNRPTQAPMQGLPFAPNSPENMQARQVPQVHPGNLPQGGQPGAQPNPSPSGAPSGQSNGASSPNQPPMPFHGTPIQNLQQFVMNPPPWCTPIFLGIAQSNLDKLMRGAPIMAVLLCLSITPAHAGFQHRCWKIVSFPARATGAAVGSVCASFCDGYFLANRYGWF